MTRPSAIDPSKKPPPIHRSMVAILGLERNQKAVKARPAATMKQMIIPTVVFNHYKIDAKIMKEKNAPPAAKVPAIPRNHFCPKSPIISPAARSKVPESQTF